MKRKNGFTLIELLIVMAILGVLAAVVIVSFPAAARKARDSRRRSDLKQYQISLEAYANRNNGLYPHSLLTGSTGEIHNYSTLCTLLGLTAPCPDDPANGNDICFENGVNVKVCDYYYRDNGTVVGPSATQYVLYTTLERPIDQAHRIVVICSNGNVREVESLLNNSNCP